MAGKTAPKNLENKLEKSQKEMEKMKRSLWQADKMAAIGQLTIGIAHEINNPIAFVSSNLETLQEYIQQWKRLWDIAEELKESVPKAEEEKSLQVVENFEQTKKKINFDFVQEDIDHVLKESLEGMERIKTIIRDLRIFGRPDATAELEWVQIEDTIESVLNIVHNEIKYKAQLKKVYGKTPKVVCYPHKLGQVFLNLLINAADAIAEKGMITIRTSVREPYVCVDIEDNGEGIPQKNLKRIFMPFFTSKSAEKGTGLGLSISRDIVEQQNGKLAVVSEAGKGSTFSVTLPIAKETS